MPNDAEQKMKPPDSVRFVSKTNARLEIRTDSATMRSLATVIDMLTSSVVAPEIGQIHRSEKNYDTVVGLLTALVANRSGVNLLGMYENFSDVNRITGQSSTYPAAYLFGLNKDSQTVVEVYFAHHRT